MEELFQAGANRVQQKPSGRDIQVISAGFDRQSHPLDSRGKLLSPLEGGS